MEVLKRLKIELKAAVEAGGPSEETFYKEWDNGQRKQYIEDHPNSKFAQEDKSGSKSNPQEKNEYSDKSDDDLNNQIKKLQEELERRKKVTEAPKAPEKKEALVKKPEEVKKPEFKERETGESKRLGKVNITDTGVEVNDKDKDILRSVSGQLSDGIWENSRAMEKYWRNLDFDEKDGNLVIHTKSEGWDNPFRAMDDQKIREYVAGKIKQIVKTELRDNGADERNNWNRNNDTELDYLTRNNENPITVKDAYKLYDALLGRKARN